jgi:hypothetical protein
MNFFRKLLVVFVILITSYILYRLYCKRQKLLAGDFTENFALLYNTPSSELGSMQSIAIQSTAIMNMSAGVNPLNQYIIKSAYNCACSGSFFSTDAIDYVLDRGCRWLDFEVFYHVRKQDIFVSKSQDDKNFAFNVGNAIPLRDALAEVISYGTSSSSPNNTDPLFVQIRPKILDENTHCYPMVAKTIVAAFGNKLVGSFSQMGEYTPTQINPSVHTPNTFLQKIAIVLDVAYIKNPQDCPLVNYANIIVGDSNITKQSYSKQVKSAHESYDIDFTNNTTTITKYSEVVPDSNSGGNISFYNMVYYFGVQITPAMFYFNDTELYNYEILFENQRTAFCPLALANRYIKTTSPYNKQSS